MSIPTLGVFKVELGLSLPARRLRREENVRQHRYNDHDRHHRGVGSLKTACCSMDSLAIAYLLVSSMAQHFLVLALVGHVPLVIHQ